MVGWRERTQSRGSPTGGPLNWQKGRNLPNYNTKQETKKRLAKPVGKSNQPKSHDSLSNPKASASRVVLIEKHDRLLAATKRLRSIDGRWRSCGGSRSIDCLGRGGGGRRCRGRCRRASG